jgi:phospholipase C
VIISPYVRPGSVLRPAGAVPFDHTSIIATLRRLVGFQPLTARDAAAPDLLGLLDSQPTNDGPPEVSAPVAVPAPARVAQSAARPLNDMQQSLSTAALHLPTAGADIATHIQRLQKVPDTPAQHRTVGEVSAVVAHMRAFLGRP